MNKKRVFPLIFILVVSSVIAIWCPSVEADKGYAKVYIICLSGVGGWWVDDPSVVKDGAVQALTPSESTDIPWIHPKHGRTPPFYSVSYQVVSSWTTYKTIIESQEEVIVINTHGEITPIPSGYSREGWTDKIAEAMLNRRVSWVHIAGYPFFRVWYQGASSSEEWGEAGFKRLMSHINKSDVTCWSPTTATEKVDLTSAAMQNLAFGFDGVYNARKVELQRPLKQSDFEDYLVMPIYDYLYGGQRYYTGAIIAFAKPGVRLNPSEEYGFGAYVHIGTNQTFDPYENPTDKDYCRGYVGTAAALWQEVSGFNAKGMNAGSLQVYPNGEAAIFVKPVISTCWKDGTDWKIQLCFSVYGSLRTYDWNDGYFISSVVAYAGNIPSNCTIVMWTAKSKNGYGNDPVLDGIYISEENRLIAETLLFFLQLAPHPLISWPATALGGLLLYSDWIGLSVSGYESGVDEPASYVHFWYDPDVTYTEPGDGYRYDEFESIIVMELTVPESDRSRWRVIPFDWSVNLNPSTGDSAIAKGGSSIAIWFGSGDTLTVLFEDFEDDLSGWSVGDSNPSAGNDYWGISDIKARTAWCAQVGDNSIEGVPNSDVLKYDIHMNASLTKSVSLSDYSSAKLKYQIWPYGMETDFDYLYVEYFDPVIDPWYTLKTYTGSTFNWFYDNVSVPTRATAIRFRFWSDSSVIDVGVFIDNVEIIATEGSNSSGGGCPFVYAWNGAQYVVDNNLLAASEGNEGVHVEDYYKLEQTVVSQNGKQSLRISEFEHEHSYLDQIGLLAVDHESSASIAVAPDGQILTYKNPHAPLSATDDEGGNWLTAVESIGGFSFEGDKGDYLILDFGDQDISDGARLVMRADLPPLFEKWSVYVQVLNATQDWATVAVVIPRAYWATEIVDLTNHLPDANGDLTVRLYFTANHKIDYVGLDTSKQADFDVRYATLASAVHSVEGNIKDKLSESDGICAELIPGEHIELAFTSPKNSKNMRRTFIFYVKGYYYRIPNGN